MEHSFTEEGERKYLRPIKVSWARAGWQHNYIFCFWWQVDKFEIVAVCRQQKYFEISKEKLQKQVGIAWQYWCSWAEHQIVLQLLSPAALAWLITLITTLRIFLKTIALANIIFWANSKTAERWDLKYGSNTTENILEPNSKSHLSAAWGLHQNMMWELKSFF